MAENVHAALLEVAPALAKPGRGLKRLIAEADQVVGDEDVVAAAAGEEASHGWPTPAVVAVTATRLCWSKDRGGPEAVPLDSISSAEVTGTEMQVVVGDSTHVFRCPHIAAVRDAMQLGGVHVPAVRPAVLERFVRLDEPLSEVLDACVVLGGSGPYPLRFGENVKLRFLNGELTVTTEAGTAVGPYRYEDLIDIGLGGAGRMTTNAGVIGGGFGLEGAVTGMAIAGVLNALTTRTTVESIIHLSLPDGEIFLSHSRFAPDQLRVMLSQAFMAIRTARNPAIQ